MIEIFSTDRLRVLRLFPVMHFLSKRIIMFPIIDYVYLTNQESLHRKPFSPGVIVLVLVWRVVSHVRWLLPRYVTHKGLCLFPEDLPSKWLILKILSLSWRWSHWDTWKPLCERLRWDILLWLHNRLTDVFVLALSCLVSIREFDPDVDNNSK